MPQLFRRSLLCTVLVASASGAQIPDSPPPRLTAAQAIEPAKEPAFGHWIR